MQKILDFCLTQRLRGKFESDTTYFTIDKVVNIANFRSTSRLAIEIEPEQHRQIKTLATFAGMTIKEFILTKTLAPQAGNSADTTDRLHGNPKNATRLRKTIAQPASSHLVFETLKDVKDALGI